MIRKLVLKNFRTHKHSEFNFVDGVNCIIGLPDSGKTNVIRAINWILTNRPLGRRMLSNFTEEPASVEIQFDEHKITLEKDKKTSIYKLDGSELHAIGSDVPDEITQIANVSELNIQRQLDKPYLICSSAGEVAKTFNRITRLEKPDEAISKITTDINSERKRYKHLLEEEDSLNAEIDSLGDVDKMDADFQRILKMNIAFTTLLTVETGLKILVRNIQAVENEKNKISKILSRMKKDLKELEELQSEYDSKKEKLMDLEDCLKNITVAKRRVEEVRKEQKKVAKEFRDFLDTIKVCPFCDKCKTPVSAHNLDDVIKDLL